VRTWISGLLLAALASGPAGAQGKTEIAELSLEALLDPEVVTASRRPERASEAPSTVFVLSADELRRQGFSSIADALASVPGLFVSDQRTFQYLGVRGLNFADDNSTHVLILLDGHPLNNSGLVFTYLSRDLPVTLAALERIEVIFGPVGGVYGPFAFFAVINLVTSAGHPGAAAFVAGDADGARPNGFEGGLTVDQRLGPLEVFLHAGVFRSQGADFTLPGLATPERPAPGGGAVPGTDFGEAQNVYARLRWSDLTLSLGFASRNRGDPFASYLSVAGDTRNAWGNRLGFASLTWERQLLPSFHLLARVSYDVARATDRFIYPDPPEGSGPVADFARDTWWSAEVRSELRPWEQTRVTLGLEAQLHDTLQLYTADLLPPVTVDPVNGVGTGQIVKSYRSLNGYLLVEQGLGQAWALQAGLNAYSNSMVGERLTGKLAAVFRLDAFDTLKALWSQGFRPPTVGEALYDDATYYTPNLALRSERAQSVEGIFDHRFGATATLRLNAYATFYRDLIAYQSVPAPGLGRDPDPANPADYRLQAQNTDSANLVGAEAAVRLQLGEALHGYGGVSLARAVGNSTSGINANFPRVTGALALSTQWPWQPLTLSVSGQFVSDRPMAALPEEAIPPSVAAYLRLNASARLAVPGVPDLFLQASVSDLLGSIREPLPADQQPLRSYLVPGPTCRLLLEYRR
jgi:iron complex outermembrane receptor protein